MKEDSRRIIKDITVIALLIVIVFGLEEAMSFLPNIQLTVFLFILYSKKLKYYKVLIIVFIHTFLDNIFFGSLNLIYTPAMLLGWILVPTIIKLFFNKTESPLLLGIASIICSITYSLIFAIPQVLINKLNFIDYIIADIPFEILLIISSFISTLLLYKPLSKVFDKYINN